MTSQTVGSTFTGADLLPNYVNGRLLTAQDLATGQSTLLARDARLGRAAGAGVVDGLWTGSTAITLTVAPGLGVARSGQPVVLPNPITLALTPLTGSTAAVPVGFGCACGCGSTTTTSGLATGTYLLTARPAQRTEGQASVVPPPDTTVSTGCAARWTAEGVEFRAITLPIPATVAGATVTDGNRRNLTAHWCYGTEQLTKLPIFPFTFNPAYSGFDQLAATDLTDADLPLAVFRWDGQSVADLDNWAARRRITTPDPVPDGWAGVTADRRDADGQARFRQFQDQVAQIDAGTQAGRMVAADAFGLLPPVGFLPVFYNSESTLTKSVAPQPDRVRAMSATQDGLVSLFDPWLFFSGVASFGGTVPWAVADFALRQSWQEFPVSTVQVYEGDTALTWYWVTENWNATDSSIPLYAFFTVDMPWQGDNLPMVVKATS